jgi:hypothetical protein
MNQRDRELLEKQFVWLRPAPSYGSLKLAVTVAALLVGLGIGSTAVLHDPNSEVGASTKVPVALLAAYDAGKRAY